MTAAALCVIRGCEPGKHSLHDGSAENINKHEPLFRSPYADQHKSEIIILCICIPLLLQKLTLYTELRGFEDKGSRLRFLGFAFAAFEPIGKFSIGRSIIDNGNFVSDIIDFCPKLVVVGVDEMNKTENNADYERGKADRNHGCLVHEDIS